MAKALIAEHAIATDSRWSNSILDDWARLKGEFWQVCPKEMLSRLEHPLDETQSAVAAE